jgi:hypothetical protein
MAQLIFALGMAAIGAQGMLTSLNMRIEKGECSNATLTTGSNLFAPSNRSEASSDVAQLFDIFYGDTFKVVTSLMAKEQYVLTQCGQAPPSDTQVNALVPLPTSYVRKQFSVPLQRAIAMSTVHLGFLDHLGVQDRIEKISQYATGSCWQKALSCGSKLEDAYGNASVASQQKDAVDAVFMSCSGTGDCTALNSRSNAVHVPTTQDPGPLNSAEYIKYFGAFFNKEPLANERFTAIVSAYKSAATSGSSTPVVAWVSYSAPSSWSEEKFSMSQATYKLNMTTDAGGMNLDPAAAFAAVPGVKVTTAVSGKTFDLIITEPSGSKANSSSYFMKALANVDVLLDETYAPDPNAYTFQTFLSNFDLTESSELKFVKNKMVLRIDGTMSTAKGLDWYESRIARPDWAVEGLARCLHSDSSKVFKYFRNLAKGETPKVLDASACTDPLPVCEASVQSSIIPMLTASPTPPGGDSPSDAAKRSSILGFVTSVWTLAAARSVQLFWA